MSERPDREILILGIEDDDDRALFRRGQAEYRREAVSAERLREQLTKFIDGLSPALSDLAPTIGDFRVEEIQISAEVSTKGTVSLLGSGGEIGATGGILITLKRDQGPDCE